MKVHRFIVDTIKEGNTRIITDPGVVHQMKSVLRLTPHETVDILDGKGVAERATITDISHGQVIVHLVSVTERVGELPMAITLYAAILKKELFELVVQKTTELGVARIVPLVTERTVKLGIREDRLQIIAKEAVEQSGRTVVPEILTPMKFADALKHAKSNEQNYFFDMGAPCIEKNSPTKSIGLFIGPEGGWTEHEREEANTAGLTFASVAPTTLRGETAAIVATFWAHG